MVNPSDRVYWDANVVIDALEKNSRYQHIEPMLKQAEAGNLQIVVSEIMRAEVLRIGKENDTKAERLISEFYEHEYVHSYAANAETMTRAGELRKRFKGLDTADAVHLATALESNCSAFITRDGDGKKGKILKLKSKISEVEIVTPADYFESISTEVRQTEIEGSKDVKGKPGKEAKG